MTQSLLSKLSDFLIHWLEGFPMLNKRLGLNAVAVFISIGILIATPIHAASFDCVKAGTLVEKMICSDKELSALDDSLSAAYSAFLEQQRNSVIKVTQRAWLKERNQCKNRSCTVAAYIARLAEVSRLGDGRKESTLSQKEAISVCENVLVSTKSGTISQYYLPAEVHEDAIEYKGVDLDGDGISDRVRVGSGTSESVLQISPSTGNYFEHDDGLMTILKLKENLFVLVTYRDRPRDRQESIAHRLYELDDKGLIFTCDTWFETIFEEGR